MTTISAKVIAHSMCEVSHNEIVTFQLRYPRWIHAEFMTHRQFSRNASSSRAVPVSRLIDDILEDPAIPLHWGKNQKGMQADEECNNSIVIDDPSLPAPYMLDREQAWCKHMYEALEMARVFDKAGYHKQIVNRLLEPFSHINVVVTATEWSNFFALRDHKDAEPHIAMLARAMKKAKNDSMPIMLMKGMWHTPYINSGFTYSDMDAVKCSVARCARVSYLTHEGTNPTVEEDLGLYTRLLASQPLHASPAEHQATPDPYRRVPDMWGNFVGFMQYRKTLQGECQ